MYYCYVVDGTVEVGPCPLPETWDGISNFNAVDDATAISYGWYPFVETPPINFDRLNQREVMAFDVRTDYVTTTRTLVALTPGEVAELVPRYKAEAIGQVNLAAGNARAKYITVIPGQEATYLWKEQEARAWSAATAPVDEDYPILYAEAQACNLTMAEVVALVLTTAAQFRTLAAEIEGLRRGTITAIEAASTWYQVEAALVIMWP